MKGHIKFKIGEIETYNNSNSKRPEITTKVYMKPKTNRN